MSNTYNQMENAEAYETLIEEAIQLLGIDPVACQTDTPYKWNLHRGQAQVVMVLRTSKTHKREDRDSLVIVSPIVIVPREKNRKVRLYELLLKTSHQLITESFSVATEDDGTEVAYLSSTYFIGEMRKEEVAFLLDSASFYAHKFSEQLRTEFMAQPKKKDELPPFRLDD